MIKEQPVVIPAIISTEMTARSWTPNGVKSVVNGVTYWHAREKAGSYKDAEGKRQTRFKVEQMLGFDRTINRYIVLPIPPGE